jgi:hypothetical protein
VAILAASAFSVVGMTAVPLQKAVAQGVTITTSADSHDGTFFGEGAVQVVINDPDADDDDAKETIQVEIEADGEGNVGDTGTFTIFETSDSSGRFELFLVHADSTLAPIDFDAINVDGAEEHESLTADEEASIIRFGGAGGEELDFTNSIYDDVSFDITVDDETVTVDFEEAPSDLELTGQHTVLTALYTSSSLTKMATRTQQHQMNSQSLQ